MANTTGLGKIRWISWNINGIQHPVKVSRIFVHLKWLGSEIMYLQETHLHPEEHNKLDWADISLKLWRQIQGGG